ncbi:MAG: hypothetical protein AABZ64_00095 [Nitrospinota bacterium]
MAVFQVDFDGQKGVLRRHEVRFQSTLIVFKGRAEQGRSTGDVDRERIRALMEKGL